MSLERRLIGSHFFSKRLILGFEFMSSRLQGDIFAVTPRLLLFGKKTAHISWYLGWYVKAIQLKPKIGEFPKDTIFPSEPSLHSESIFFFERRRFFLVGTPKMTKLLFIFSPILSLFP